MNEGNRCNNNYHVWDLLCEASVGHSHLRDEAVLQGGRHRALQRESSARLRAPAVPGSGGAGCCARGIPTHGHLCLYPQKSAGNEREGFAAVKGGEGDAKHSPRPTKHWKNPLFPVDGTLSPNLPAPRSCCQEAVIHSCVLEELGWACWVQRCGAAPENAALSPRAAQAVAWWILQEN